MDNFRPSIKPSSGVESVKTDKTPQQSASSTSVAPGVSVAKATGASAGVGLAVARTAAKIETKSHIQRATALIGTSTGLSQLAKTVSLGKTGASSSLSTQASAPGDAATEVTLTHSPPTGALQVPTVVTDQPGMSSTVDAFASAWQVQKRKGKGKRTQLTQSPHTDPSGPPAPSDLYKRREKQTRKEQCQPRFVEIKSGKTLSSIRVIFTTGKQAQAGTSRPKSSQPLASEVGSAPTAVTQRSGWKDQAVAKRALNETISPRGEHKRPRLNQSKRDANTSYAQAASSPMNVVITCDRTGIISKETSDQVLTAIQRQIISEACSPVQDSPGPTFNAKPLFAKGVLKLWCGNDHTLTWLKRTVSGLALPTGTTLVVKSQSELQKRARCGVVIPDKQGVYEKPTDIGRALSYQNPWIDIKKWSLHFSEKQAAAWFVVVSIPEDQIPTLMKAGRRLAIGLGAVYVRFQGWNGKFTEVPRGWDPTTETIRDELKRPPTTGETALTQHDAVATAAQVL